jgi:hypothetical protein
MATLQTLTIAKRIMSISGRNTLVAVILANLGEQTEMVIAKIESLKLRKCQIVCIWSHFCDANKLKFIEYILAMTSLPKECPRGIADENREPCNWEPKSRPDESHIFGPELLPSEKDCAMTDCDTPATATCSRCYTVRYCSALCQRLDWKRHATECKKVTKAIAMVAPYGIEYARRVIRNNIRISDAQFDRLWQSHTAV